MAIVNAETDAPSVKLMHAEAKGGFFAGLHLLFLRTIGAVSRYMGNRGMQRCTWLLARYLFGGNNSTILQLAPGGKLKIRLGDGYWTRLLIPSYIYEPEIWSALTQVLSDPNIFFLDCGANIGYWSVICSQLLPSGHTLALEAAPPNYAQLVENARLNGGKFQTVLGALWERDGETVAIVSHDLRHAGSSIVNRREKIGMAGYHQHTVLTVTIDSLCERYMADLDAKIVVKLDVEGAEIQALKGGGKLLRERPALILYEDHAQETESHVSEYLMTQLGFTVYYCGEKGHIRHMESLADVHNVKADPAHGFNFVAFAPGSSWAKAFCQNEP